MAAPRAADSRRKLGGRLSKFATVGGLGFVVDAAILSLLVHVGDWPHYSARAVSFATAVTVTWYCNRHWVFSRTADSAREYGTYFGVQSVGAVINLGTYALAAGAALAVLFNYSAASRWMFAVSPSGDRRREP